MKMYYICPIKKPNRGFNILLNINMSEKVKFGSKVGVIAATVGSAVGLGNIWRFPSEAQENGGAIFLIIYLACILFLGIPVMLAEFSLGRSACSDVTSAYTKFTPHKKWWFNGVLALVAAYLIMSFYMVVAGWTLEYLWQSITGGLYDGYNGVVANGDAFFVGKMNTMLHSDWNSLLWTGICITINLFVLLRGVQKGIEKMSNLMMPVLFIILLVLCAVSLSLPKAAEGVMFFLKPDLSALNADVFISALGQAFFSLSLGLGILITFAAYYPHDTKLTSTATTVALLDFFVAFVMGLIIFPGMKSFALDTSEANFAGTTLVFVTLPEIFANIGGTRIWSILFFMLLSVAAITSTISLAEVTIFSIQSRFKKSRKMACIIAIVPLFLTSSLCSLSQGSLGWLKIGGLNLFDFLDTVATNFMLPIGSIFLCIYVGWILPRSFLKEQLTNNGTVKSRVFPLVLLSIRYIAPILILIILISSILDVLK